MQVPGRLVAILTLAAAMLLPLAWPGAAAARDGTPGRSLWFWRWSDGGEQRVRVVEVGGAAPAWPHLVATVVPAERGRRVIVQVWSGGRWRTEDSATTNAAGVARLGINPFCADGDWCRRQVEYRLLAEGRTARLSVRFRD